MLGRRPQKREHREYSPMGMRLWEGGPASEISAWRALHPMTKETVEHFDEARRIGAVEVRIRSGVALGPYD
jgi:hypothetical protein